jgi:hypothetical protein
MEEHEMEDLPTKHPRHALLALDALEAGSSLDDIAAALRGVAVQTTGADRLGKALAREESIRRLTGIGIKSAAKVVDAALHPADGCAVMTVRWKLVSRIGAARITRDTGPSAAFLGVRRTRVQPHPSEPYIRVGLTRSRSVRDPIRNTLALAPGTARFDVGSDGATGVGRCGWVAGGGGQKCSTFATSRW